MNTIDNRNKYIINNKNKSLLYFYSVTILNNFLYSILYE